MELEVLKQMWQAHETKLEHATRLNLQTLEMVQSQRVRSALVPLLIKNRFILLMHGLTLLALLWFIVYNWSQWPYVVSGCVLLGYYILLFANTYSQIQAINQIEQGKDVISMQVALARLKSHMLYFIRLSVLTIPAFLSFPVVVPRAFANLEMKVFSDFDIIKQTHGTWWLVEIIAFAVLIPLGIWFYRQVRPQNTSKKWVKHIIESTSDKGVVRAVRYLKELEDIKAG
jgi:hypothetical protein